METVRIAYRPVVEGLPKNRRVMFFGKLDSETFFVIHKPNDGTSKFGVAQLMRGPAGKLEDDSECKYSSIWNAFNFTKVETHTDLFIFPSNTPDEVEKLGRPRPATFNGEPIEVFSTDSLIF
jgi:hypothetical protein